MVIENISNVTVDIVSNLSQPVVQGLDFLVKVGIGVSIAIIAYVLYLIVKGLLRARTAGKVKKILQVLERIDYKLDKIVDGKVRGKSGKKKGRS